MKMTLHTRLILWRKQWMSLIFWLLFPLGMTLLMMSEIGIVQDEITIPVGLVIEDDSEAAEELIHAIQTTEHLQPFILQKREALHELETHEIDSVFIIRKNYAQKIGQAQRNHVIDAYDSDLSFAYPSVRETILSLVQQDYMLSTTVQTIQQMGLDYQVGEKWTAESLKSRSAAIIEEQKLLDVEFSFANTFISEQEATTYLINPHHLWMLFAILGTFMTFDWIVKEKKERVIDRLLFTRLSIKNYLLNNWLIHTFLLFLIDILTIYVLSQMYGTLISWQVIISIFSFRVMLNSCIFMTGRFFKTPMYYYVFSFCGTLLLTVISGVFIPIDGILESVPLLFWLHPLTAFQSYEWINIWLMIGLGTMLISYLRKGETHA